LEEFLHRAREAHPARYASVDSLRFVRFAEGKSVSRPGELLLAFAALERVPEALETLRQQVRREVAGAVRQNATAATLAPEIEQRLFTQLLVGEAGKAPKLNEYSARGPLGAWLRAAASGIALNLQRSERAQAHEGDSDLDIASSNPELELLQAACGAEFVSAFRTAMASMTLKERNLLRLRFIDGLTLPALATYFRVHRATVVRWLAEVSEQVFQETQRMLNQRLGNQAPQVVSLLREAGSRPDFSLGQLLKE